MFKSRRPTPARSPVIHSDRHSYGTLFKVPTLLLILFILLLSGINAAFLPVSSWLGQRTTTDQPARRDAGIGAWITPTVVLPPKVTPPLQQAAVELQPVAATPLPAVPAIPAAPPADAVEQGITHVVIISIDGLRPDALDQANTPTLDDLRNRGSYCSHAQTVIPSYTLPGHASMLSGMVPEKHGLLWGLPYIGWPGLHGPTVFNVVHDAGLRTAMVAGKKKLDYMALPGSVDILAAADVHDPEVEEQAVKIIQDGLPELLFVHLPDTDRVGHEYGWMSENQLYAVTFADGMIGEIEGALAAGDYLDTTLLLITADHGGHEHGHGDDSPLDRTIPWLAVGPGVPQGTNPNTEIYTYDTAATAVYALGLDIPEIWDGRPVMSIFPQHGE